ncbi:MAG: SDR family NAD(P)-dependent oxidoreductase [Myxococcales bacterium]|nr:SDR family NAD(P)-dependent oxidoreductase [Myxococcales bacterium]
MSIETKHLSTVVEQHTQDMTGKVVAITGTTSGTGYVCARELAKLGAEVLLLNRESPRSARAAEQLRAEVPGGRFVPITCDLQDFASVRRAAQEISAKYGVVDVLCNNAGVMALPDEATKDGYDVQMQTNCLSHFLLTKELFGALAKSADGRVVNHTSMARLGPPLAPEYFGKNGGNLGGDGTEQENASFSGPRWMRYHQTKLANCAFTYGLKQRLDAKGVTNVKVLLAHPGLAATSLQTTTAQTGGMDMGSGLMNNAQSAEDGALGIIRGCADPAARSGDFYGPKQWVGFPGKLEPEPALLDPENVRVNWEGCEAAVGPFNV